MALISIVGSYPPNYGGIATHIRRLHILLGLTHDCRVIDLYGKGGEVDVEGVDRIYGNSLRRVWRCRSQLNRLQSAIEHFHISAMRKFLWSTPVLLTGRIRRRVLTIHDGDFPEVVAAFTGWEKKLFRWMLSRFEHFICVSDEQRDVLDSWGVTAERISIINAYLPPMEGPHSGKFVDIEQARAEGKCLLVCAAQYQEHYGIEELTLAMTKLEAELGKDATRLALISYARVDDAYRKKCQALRTKTAPFFEFVDLEPERVSELLSLGDVFVRPTWWDGDAISVREAAFFGNRLVASDVTTRPAGTVLCQARDAESLYQALKLCIVDSNQGVVSFDHQRSLRALASVYEKFSVIIL